MYSMYVSACMYLYVLVYFNSFSRMHMHAHTHILKGSNTLAVSGAATVTVYLNSTVSACTCVLQFFLSHAHTRTHYETD